MTEMKLEKILGKRVKLLLNFFFKVRSWGVVVCLILMVLAGIASYFTLPYGWVHTLCGCLTALFFLLFLLALLRLFNSNITQEEAEAVFAYDRKVVYDELFRNLSLEKNRSNYQAEPIELIVPEEYPRINTIVYRFFPKTGKLFYSQIKYSWILFGEKSMHYYHASVNHIHGYTGYEGSYEFDYKDIVSVKTLVTHENNVEKLILTLSLVNGETLDITLRSVVNKVYESTHKLSEKEALILSTIRKVIRGSK